MNDPIERDVREYFIGERRFLPVSALIATAVCVTVWYWRLDQLADPSLTFLLGILVGALLTCVLQSAVAIIHLGAMLRGLSRKSSLLQKAIWLSRRDPTSQQT